MSSQSEGGDDLPDWLRDLPSPTPDEVSTWNERQAAREEALDVVTGGLLAGDPARVALGNRMLADLPPVGTIGLQRPRAVEDDLLTSALSGNVTSRTLVEALEQDAVALTDAQRDFVQADAVRLRVLTLSIKQGTDPFSLETALFPEGQPRLTMAARGSAQASRKLAAWLESHPEETGVEGTLHWHG